MKKKLHLVVIFLNLLGVYFKATPMVQKINYTGAYNALERMFPEYTSEPVEGAEDPYAGHPLKTFNNNIRVQDNKIQEDVAVFVAGDENLLQALGKLMSIDDIVTAQAKKITTLTEEVKQSKKKMANAEEGSEEETLATNAWSAKKDELTTAQTDLKKFKEQQSDRVNEEKKILAQRAALHAERDKEMALFQSTRTALITANSQEAKFLRAKMRYDDVMKTLPGFTAQEKKGKKHEQQIDDVIKIYDALFKKYAYARAVRAIAAMIDKLVNENKELTDKKDVLEAPFKTAVVITKVESIQILEKTLASFVPVLALPKLSALKQTIKKELAKAVMWKSKASLDAWDKKVIAVQKVALKKGIALAQQPVGKAPIKLGTIKLKKTDNLETLGKKKETGTQSAVLEELLKKSKKPMSGKKPQEPEGPKKAVKLGFTIQKRGRPIGELLDMIDVKKAADLNKFISMSRSITSYIGLRKRKQLDPTESDALLTLNADLQKGEWLADFEASINLVDLFSDEKTFIIDELITLNRYIKNQITDVQNALKDPSFATNISEKFPIDHPEYKIKVIAIIELLDIKKKIFEEAISKLLSKKKS